jgi:CTP:molybdopterin cytidylyltransferase MocA
MSVLAVVAAAGRSFRMGRTKALVPFGPGGPPLVVHIVGALLDGGVDDVVVTVPADPRDAAAIHAEVDAALRGGVHTALAAPSPAARGRTGPGVVDDHARRVSFARNGEPGLSLTGSVRAALARATDATEHLVVAPVDAPFFDADLVRALLLAARSRASDVDVVVAVDRSTGARGHPVVFARACFAALREADARGGPVAVVDAAAARGRVTTVASDDARIASDVDAPADWERAFAARWPMGFVASPSPVGRRRR